MGFADSPPVLFFHLGDRAQGDDFFRRHWPEARAVADRAQLFYRGFGLERGTVGQVLGPRVWWRGLAAAFKGNLVGKPVGDPMVMPGVFLVESRSVIWSHDFRHAGDHPDFSAIPDPA